MSDSHDPKSDPGEKVVGCLFPLIGGGLGIFVGSIGALFLEPIVLDMYQQEGDELRGLNGVCVESFVMIAVSGFAGLIAFSYFELKRRK